MNEHWWIKKKTGSGEFGWFDHGIFYMLIFKNLWVFKSGRIIWVLQIHELESLQANNALELGFPSVNKLVLQVKNIFSNDCSFSTNDHIKINSLWDLFPAGLSGRPSKLHKK